MGSDPEGRATPPETGPARLRPASPDPVPAPEPQPPADLPADTRVRTVSTAGTIGLDSVTTRSTSTTPSSRSSSSPNGDKIIITDLQGEILAEHTRPAPGITYVGNGRPPGPARRTPNCHRSPDTPTVTDVLRHHTSPLSVVAGRIEHMIETLAGPRAGGVDDLTARDLLASIKARASEDAEAARRLVLAARWADLHPPESIHDAAAFTVPGCEHEEPIAGEGAPLVAEFCLAELGTVLGVSTSAAKRLVGHALELRHRLPRLWAQVHAGRVPAWRARAVAEATIHRPRR